MSVPGSTGMGRYFFSTTLLIPRLLLRIMEPAGIIRADQLNG